MKFHLRIYDNYHHWDKTKAYNHGEYDNYNKALNEVKFIVYNWLREEWVEGKTPADILASFALYGESPVILPNEHGENDSFSASTYAHSIAEELCKKLELTVDTQSRYQKAIRFAGEKLKDQLVPGSKSNYVMHLSNVAMEILIASYNTNRFDTNFAVQVALLHDIIEDTETTFNELESNFGQAIAEVVLTLTKNKDLPKEQQIQDSLNRIKVLQPEVWAVKLADRITNLQPPPAYWNSEKRKNYLDQAKLILKELNLTEGKGTGIPTIKRALKNNGSPPAKYDTDGDDRRFFLIEIPVHPEFIAQDLAQDTDLINSKKENRDQGKDQGRDQDTSLINKEKEIWNQVKNQVGNQVKDQVTERIIKTLRFCFEPKTKREVLDNLNLTNKSTNFKLNVLPAIEVKLLEMTIPDNPNSMHQKYITTEKGKKILSNE